MFFYIFLMNKFSRISLSFCYVVLLNSSLQQKNCLGKLIISPVDRGWPIFYRSNLGKITDFHCNYISSISPLILEINKFAQLVHGAVVSNCDTCAPIVGDGLIHVTYSTLYFLRSFKNTLLGWLYINEMRAFL